MNDSLGGWLVIVAGLFGIGLAVTWLLLPFILIGKLNTIADELRIIADLLRRR